MLSAQVSSSNENFISTIKNLLKENRLNFSRSALFHMKTEVGLNFFCNNYRHYKQIIYVQLSHKKPNRGTKTGQHNNKEFKSPKFYMWFFSCWRRGSVFKIESKQHLLKKCQPNTQTYLHWQERNLEERKSTAMCSKNNRLVSKYRVQTPTGKLNVLQYLRVVKVPFVFIALNRVLNRK